MSRFGEQRLLRSVPERAFFTLLGVADPAHYLHHRYLRLAVERYGGEPRRIMDAGCGYGDHTMWLARRFPEAEVLGVDIDPEGCARAQEAADQLGITNVRFETLDLCQLDVKGFDLIVSIDVLEHVPNQRDVLRRLAEALDVGGLAFYHIPTERPKPVLFSNRLSEFHAWAEDEHIEDDLTPGEVEERVAESGLEIVEARQTFGRWTGELGCSLFLLPYRNTPLNRLAQLAVTPVARVLAWGDTLGGGSRYALAVTGRKPASS